jgi:hypothetical protein
LGILPSAIWALSTTVYQAELYFNLCLLFIALAGLFGPFCKSLSVCSIDELRQSTAALNGLYWALKLSVALWAFSIKVAIFNSQLSKVFFNILLWLLPSYSDLYQCLLAFLMFSSNFIHVDPKIKLLNFTYLYWSLLNFTTL